MYTKIIYRLIANLVLLEQVFIFLLHVAQCHRYSCCDILVILSLLYRHLSVDSLETLLARKAVQGIVGMKKTLAK